MTFEFSAEHTAVRDRARQFAQSLVARALDIDRTGEIPAELHTQAAGFASDDAFAAVVAAEEIATVSAAVAASVASSTRGQAVALSGLRGAAAPEPSSRGQLVLAAMALGIGRAAVEQALFELRQSTATPGAEVEKPHWVVADTATDVDAARLLTYKAAHTLADADVAVARLMAGAAAERAVNAALRVTGPDALAAGTLLERLSRDVRAVALIAGTEEQQRATAADALFPR